MDALPQEAPTFPLRKSKHKDTIISLSHSYIARFCLQVKTIKLQLGLRYCLPFILYRLYELPIEALIVPFMPYHHSVPILKGYGKRFSVELFRGTNELYRSPSVFEFHQP